VAHTHDAHDLLRWSISAVDGASRATGRIAELTETVAAQGLRLRVDAQGEACALGDLRLPFIFAADVVMRYHRKKFRTWSESA